MSTTPIIAPRWNACPQTGEPARKLAVVGARTLLSYWRNLTIIGSECGDPGQAHWRRMRSVALTMPGIDLLPPGPHRDLVQALHNLYRDAGKPGTRTVSAEIRRRDDLPDTVSHEAIRAILRGEGIPRWAKLQSLVRQLSTWAVGQPDSEETVQQFHALWLAASDSADRSKQSTTDTELPRPTSTKGQVPTISHSTQLPQSEDEPTQSTEPASWHLRHGPGI